jgi:hypothetical protein
MDWGWVPGAFAGAKAMNPKAPVPQTGQTTSYAAGDDGAIQAGVPWPSPRFTDHGNGTVRDNLTGFSPRQNFRYVYGWFSRPYAEARPLCHAYAIMPLIVKSGALVRWRKPWPPIAGSGPIGLRLDGEAFRVIPANTDGEVSTWLDGDCICLRTAFSMS